MICKHVYYSGRVQGVGFRYTAQKVAGNYAVTGFVRNLSEGNVELVAEGTAKEVDEFLSALARRMEGYIEEADIQDRPPEGFKEFSIRY